MFANRSKGAVMSLVLYPGGHDTQFPDETYQIVTAIIEAIFKMRVPADADATKGPVPLYDIVEGESTWVGDLYSKEISTFAAFKGDKEATSFLPMDRAEGCEEEFGQVVYAFNRLIAPHIDRRLVRKLHRQWLPPITAKPKKWRSMN